MLKLISGWIGHQQGPSVLNQSSLDGLGTTAKKQVMTMTSGLRGERREAAFKVLAEFGEQGIDKFYEFGLSFEEKNYGRYDDTHAQYNSKTKAVNLNARMGWGNDYAAEVVRHELFHTMDHLEGMSEYPDTVNTKLGYNSASLSMQDEYVQGLYQQYRSRGALQYAINYRDMGDMPYDDNPFTNKQESVIKERDDGSFVVETDPTWFTRQQGPAVAAMAALGTGLLAIGGLVAPLAGVGLLGLAAFGGRKVAKEAVARFVTEPVLTTVEDDNGKTAQVEQRGDRFVVTPEEGFESTSELWSEYAMMTDLRTEYFAEAGSRLTSGGYQREDFEKADPKMAEYVTERWEKFTGKPLPQ